MCGATLKESSPLMSETQTPPPVQRCSAPPFQIFIRAAAAAALLLSSPHFSPAHVSTASTGVAYFNPPSSATPSTVLCQPYLSQILPLGRERTAVLSQAGCNSPIISLHLSIIHNLC
ncbi:hypothetical protein D9C73_006272 [Collichthys lucidus]|uniref:Uncharacterized protein n=1 Tax=Collichthys lucidus TaxID=240159 RepID=A0A4U5UDV4_COLLU|nr:hypothetical protein D9C73_006272 [Collichthys lucidus]